MGRLVSLTDFWQTPVQKQSDVRHDATHQVSLSLSLSSAAPSRIAPRNAGGAFIQALKFPAQKFLTKLFIKVWPREEKTKSKDVKELGKARITLPLAGAAKRHLWAWSNATKTKKNMAACPAQVFVLPQSVCGYACVGVSVC